MLMPIALAQEDVEELPNQLILPGNALYGLDKAMERVQLAFTFREQSKARVRLNIAQERLAELHQLQIEKREMYGEQLMEEYQLNLGEAQRLGEQIGDLEQRKEFALMVQTATQNHIRVLERVREQTPELPAQVQNEVNAAKSKAENVRNQAEDDLEELEA